MAEKRPRFVISLDFELYWGMIDKVTLAEYGTHVRGVHSAIPRILELFEEFGLHATWATVGMLMFEDKKELLAALPPEDLRPAYPDLRLSTYQHIEDNMSQLTEIPVCYFAPKLIEKILGVPGQEIGSHTFSHYYCVDGRENGPAVFAADCDTMRRAAERFGVTPRALVFPRNQTTHDALAVAAEHGITSYRGNENSALYRGGTESPIHIRLLRLIDHYVNLTGHHTFTLETTGRLTNVPSSRFLRPWSRALAPLEPLRMRRIKNAMTHAAKRGECFHLWWHPHNFGVDQDENLATLREIAEHFKMLETEYGMESATMSEAAQSAAIMSR